jgi:hypothetical protein
MFLDMARVSYRNPQDVAIDLATVRIQVAEALLATLTPRIEAGTGQVARGNPQYKNSDAPEVFVGPSRRDGRRSRWSGDRQVCQQDACVCRKRHP